MRIRAFLLAITLGITLLLSGCWIPENFEANITVNNNGSYTFTYDGILTFALALAAAKEGSLSNKDEAALEKEVEKIRKEPGFKKVEYMGKGRYKVFVEKSGKAGEPYYFLSSHISEIFAIKPQQDGTIKITAARFSNKDLNKLRSIGANVNGTLAVSIEKGVKVLEHNAQSEPKMFGLFGAYEWEIKSIDARPFIVVQPSS